MKSSGQNVRRHWSGLLWWLCFAAGLLVQLFAPQLEIANGKFVIPPALSVEGNNIRPDEIVTKERRMKLLSALLTTIGAVGLAVQYRGVFFQRTRPGDEQARSLTVRGSALR